MSALSDDSRDPEPSKYAPKWSREQPATPNAERLRQVSTSASTVPSFEEGNQNRPIPTLWPRPVPEPPALREHGLLGWVGQTALVVVVAAVVALLVVFAKPLLDGTSSLNSDSQTKQLAKPSDRHTANDAPAVSAVVPAIAAAPPATAQAQQVPPSPAQGQQAALSPISKPPGQESSVNSAIRGVTDSEIRFGISAPFTGPAKELGQHMKQGIEAAFNVANAKGGVYGRQLRLVAADDGYEPTRTAATM